MKYFKHLSLLFVITSLVGCGSNPPPSPIYDDLETVLVYIDEEIDKRLEDGRMDEDELDKDY